MSYSIIEAKNERARDIALARADVDAPEKLRKLANIIMGDGNEELAHSLLNEADRIEWQYDEVNEN